MAWVLVPALQEFRVQINRLCPTRDKASDGVIGDFNHQQGDSSHNPDDTGRNNSEWDTDPDNKQEVRAIDVDIDFRTPGVTANKLLAHLIKYAKNGTFWWIRYFIYNEKMYHKRNDFEPVAYNGVNPHDKHIHINNDYTQKADGVSGVDYRLEELVEEEVTEAEIKRIINESSDLAAEKVIKALGEDLQTATTTNPSGIVRNLRRIAVQYPFTDGKTLFDVFDALKTSLGVEGTTKK